MIIWARSCKNMSYAICKQQRCRLACASAQSDQHLCCSLMICILVISKVSRFYLASVAEQTGFNLTWLKIPEDMFSHDVAHLNYRRWLKSVSNLVRDTFLFIYIDEIHWTPPVSQNMSHDMTKPTKWVCVQRKLRSAWASAQSDQSLRCPHEESLGP